MKWLIVILVLILFFAFYYYQNNKLDITEYKIESNNVDDNIKIVHLSDFHSKPFRKVLEKTKEVNPDMICITGDYINDKCRNKEKMLQYGKEITKIAPVYFITGNHERRLDNFEELMKELEIIGFNVLLNKCLKTDNITILGLDENQADFSDYKARKKGTFEYKDMSSNFAELEKAENFKLVLCHFPENFQGIKEVNYSQYDFDLQLSGHAHGGQWIMPFIGPLFSPGQGVLPKYARGTFGDRPKLIISRGLGNSEFPLRLFNHPEIVIVNIKKL